VADISEAQAAQIAEALKAGQKIEAIKLYREAAGVGLREAKEAVEALERELGHANPYAPSGGGAGWFQQLIAANMDGGGVAGNLTEEQAARITEHLFAGRKIDAVKIYRGAAGGGLKDAKDAMDALEVALRKECPEEFHGSGKRGCGFLVLAGGLATGFGACGLIGSGGVSWFVGVIV